MEATGRKYADPDDDGHDRDERGRSIHFRRKERKLMEKVYH